MPIEGGHGQRHPIMEGVCKIALIPDVVHGVGDRLSTEVSHGIKRTLNDATKCPLS